MLRSTIVAVTALAIASPGEAGDVLAGKTSFAAQCGLCHSAEPADDGGGQGPSLQGVFGRAAATGDATFPYTDALKKSKLVWDAVTLDRFLTNPGATVPGTAMPIAVPGKPDRDNIIAYFISLQNQRATP
jgi:cytochrome c